MRTSDGYRFGLQFKDSSDLHHQVGELLERLGNSKSKLVVTAMIEYIQTHPEILDSGRPVKIIEPYGCSEETLNAKIEEVVQKVIASMNTMPTTEQMPMPSSIQEEAAAKALDKFLNGLDMF